MDKEFKLNKAQRKQQYNALEREFLECVRRLTEEEKKELLDMMTIYARHTENDRLRKADEQERECLDRRMELKII